MSTWSSPWPLEQRNGSHTDACCLQTKSLMYNTAETNTTTTWLLKAHHRAAMPYARHLVRKESKKIRTSITCNWQLGVCNPKRENKWLMCVLFEGYPCYNTIKIILDHPRRIQAVSQVPLSSKTRYTCFKGPLLVYYASPELRDDDPMSIAK
jgi:hypothetical protein